ncbi:MAG: hypothetical protein HY791_09730 [Deltaproteobacteria bacterium]|nr:hypothetical protein [Deltaproteobacteria bacterium]
MAEYRDWPRLVAWPLLNAGREFKRFNRRELLASSEKQSPASSLGARTSSRPRSSIAPLPAGVDAQEIEREVKEAEKSLRAKKPHVLGRDAILAQPFDGQPTKTDRSWRPLCHASTNKQWFEYLEQVRAFRASMRLPRRR